MIDGTGSSICQIQWTIRASCTKRASPGELNDWRWIQPAHQHDPRLKRGKEVDKQGETRFSNADQAPYS